MSMEQTIISAVSAMLLSIGKLKIELNKVWQPDWETDSCTLIKQKRERETDRQKEKWRDRYIDRYRLWADGHIDRQIDRQIDIQIDRHMYQHIDALNDRDGDR